MHAHTARICRALWKNYRNFESDSPITTKKGYKNKSINEWSIAMTAIYRKKNRLEKVVKICRRRGGERGWSDSIRVK